MQVTLDKNYPIKAPLAACWSILSDVTDLATCMPGAAITEKTDETHYKGSVKVKVGPATAAFAGEIELLAIDANAFTIKLMGKGSDKGGSSASMELTATLQAGPDGTTSLLGKADVIVNGKFAQFGGRMMTSVSDMILAQFAGNFEIKAMALAPAAPAVGASASAETAAPAAAPAAVTELNGLAIAWMLIKNFFGGLFGKKA
ncbi:MAG: SRPBCC family protein [Burkholderiaceae bacterium]